MGRVPPFRLSLVSLIGNRAVAVPPELIGAVEVVLAVLKGVLRKEEQHEQGPGLSSGPAIAAEG